MTTPELSRADLSNILANIRTRHGLTNPQLAEYLGIGLDAIRKWNLGISKPSVTVCRMIHVLGVIEALAPDIHAHLVPVAKPKKIKRAQSVAAHSYYLRTGKFRP